MKNSFYKDFDFERLRESNRTDYRTPFQIDRDRVIHSSEFRRLQGKTQVFLPGESDYYRTRLTHSIEVEQIGRSICNYLNNLSDSPFDENYYIDPDLVESSCLGHDLGHPPFGHAGERTLNNLMSEYGGFEGNAQTLRLLTEVFYRSQDDRRGMNPTRAFIDSILKYKVIYKDYDNPVNHFVYDYQEKYLDFVFAGRDYKDQFHSIKEANDFRSIECQIMDWADDTAYAINDIVDSVSGRFITIQKLDHWLIDNETNLNSRQRDIIEDLKKWIGQRNYKPKFGSLIGDFILGCDIKERKTFMDDFTNRYKYKLQIDRALQEKADLYKRIAVDLVFTSPPLHQMEFKADEMIERMFKVFEQNYIAGDAKIKLLPDFTHYLIKNEKSVEARARIVCDYISGMTDSYALRIYKRLFDPNFSSLTDFV